MSSMSASGSRLVHVNDTRTLLSRPFGTTQRQLDPAQRLAAGLKTDMIRVSLGPEHVDHILWDIDHAPAAASA